MLLTNVGDCVACIGGPGRDSVDPLGPKIGLRSGESLLIRQARRWVDVIVSGTYAGAKLKVVKVLPSGTEAEVQVIAPADNASATTRIDFTPGSISDLKIKLGAITSGSIDVTFATAYDSAGTAAN